MSVPFPSAGEPYTITWSDAAVCRGVPIDVFYREDTTKAAAYCTVCPVTGSCLAAAVTEERGIEERTQGYRAGMTPAERIRYAQTGQTPPPRRRTTPEPFPLCEVCAAELPPPGPKGGRPRRRCPGCQRPRLTPLPATYHPLIVAVMEAENDTRKNQGQAA